MYSAILDKYNPTDVRSHSLLRFYSESLNDEECLKFIEEIFNYKGILLATEISRAYSNDEIYDLTITKYNQFQQKWIEERIIYSNRPIKNTNRVNKTNEFNSSSSYPRQPIHLKREFGQLLVSFKNLKFPQESMACLEMFFSKCSAPYLYDFYLYSSKLLVRDFEVNDIETYLSFLLDVYFRSELPNLIEYIFLVLSELALTHKIYLASDDLKCKLKALSNLLNIYIFDSSEKHHNLKYLYCNVILLIELIKNGKLDLTSNEFHNQINISLRTIQPGDPEKINYLNFLRHYNYSFRDNYFEAEINMLLNRLDGLRKSASSDDISSKEKHLSFLLRYSTLYFEYFILYQEFCPPNKIKEYFIRFVNIIDQMKNYFDPIVGFNEFNNVKVIRGKLISVIDRGFQVKVESSLHNDLTKTENKNHTTKIVPGNNLGFLHVRSLKGYPKLKTYYYNAKNSVKEKFNKSFIVDESELPAELKLNEFFIFGLKLHPYNKGAKMVLYPYKDFIHKKAQKFNLNGFFSVIDLYLIHAAHNHLSILNPLSIHYDTFRLVAPIDSFNKYKLNLSKDSFWEMLKKIRPHLYEIIYLKHEEAIVGFEKANEAYKSNLTVKGTIQHMTKGGMVVDVFGLEAFLPGSQIDVNPIIDYNVYIGKTMEFKIIKINNEFKNIVVSHKTIVKDEIDRDSLAKLEEGQVIEGIVKNITSYGVFIDIGSIDGLIHITDLSWGRFNSANEIVRPDEKIKVVILGIDKEKRRLALGLKQLTSNPWDVIVGSLKVGDKVKGKVVDIHDYGAFIEISPGVEGLVHASEISWRQPVRNAQEFVKFGQEVEAVVLALDREGRKMSLGMKQLTSDPWNLSLEKYAKGTRHIGTVRNFTNFGVFVELEDGVDGLVHKSELSWKKKIEHPSKFCSVGDKMEVVVLEIDRKNRKISLDYKQLVGN